MEEWPVLVAALLGGVVGSVVSPLVSYKLTRKHERDLALWRHRHGRIEEMIARAGEITGRVVAWGHSKATERWARAMCHTLRSFSAEFRHIDLLRRAIDDLEQAVGGLIADRRESSKEYLEEARAQVDQTYRHLVKVAYQQLE